MPVRSRLRRWLRRIAIAVALVFVAVTLSALGFDLATNGDARPASALYRGPFARVGNTLVAYRRWGSSGPPILLLAGAAEPSWVWHLVGPLLASKGHRVYAIDLPPFGYTERHGPYTMSGWLALVHGFERRLNIRHPVVIGHSLGAGVAAAAALRYPRSVAGIVLLDGDALPFGGSRNWLADLLVYPYYPAVLRILSSSDWLVGKVLRNAWGSGGRPFDHQTLKQFERPFRVAGTEPALKQLMRGGIPGVTTADLRTLRLPRAVVWGAHDTVDPLSSGKGTAAALGVRIDVIPAAGHLSMLAQPQAVARAIEKVAGP